MTSLVLALASANIASAQLRNTTNGPNAVKTNGDFAGASITTGDDNSAYGFSALQFTDTGLRNTAVGSLALKNNTAGNNNTAVGFGTLSVSIANNNTALGYEALFRNTSGANNTATGVSALINTTTGSFNTTTGREALSGNIGGTNNTAVGYQALLKNTSGDFNVALGDGALLNNITGTGNIGIGEDGGFNLTVGDNNICIGSKGVAGDVGKIRIGTNGTHTDTFLTGIIHGNGSGLTGVTGLANNAVTSPKIAAGAVISSKLAVNLTLGGTTTGTFSGNLTGTATNVTGIVAIANGGTGSAVQNFVDLTTNQTSIGGTKAFTGNVGIGTPGPITKLTVWTPSATAVQEGIRINNPVGFAGNGNGSSLVFSQDRSPAENFINATIQGVQELADSSGNGYLAFSTRSAGAVAEKMRITSNGSVGIGTSGPTAQLQVEGVRNLSGGDTPNLSIGTFTGSHLEMDSNEIQAGNGNPASSNPSTLFLNHNGGDVQISEAGSTTAVMGDLGIGTTNPTRAKVEISGVAGSTSFGQRGIFDTTGASSASNTGNDTRVSLWASDDVWGKFFFAFSDERIKRIQGRSDARRDLATLLGIEITDYTYIDTLANGSGRQKKVIAQQVETVYPQAVRHGTDVVPDIYQKAEVREGWVKLVTNLKKGERVRLIGENEEGIHEVLEVREGAFRTAFQPATEQVFVYGREVNDFRAVDYEAIAMLNVSATQELARKLEAKDAEIARLGAMLAALEARDKAREAREQAREARLARLENALDNRPVQARAVNAALRLK